MEIQDRKRKPSKPALRKVLGRYLITQRTIEDGFFFIKIQLPCINMLDKEEEVMKRQRKILQLSIGRQRGLKSFRLVLDERNSVIVPQSNEGWKKCMRVVREQLHTTLVPIASSLFRETTHGWFARQDSIISTMSRKDDNFDWEQMVWEMTESTGIARADRSLSLMTSAESHKTNEASIKKSASGSTVRAHPSDSSNETSSSSAPPPGRRGEFRPSVTELRIVKQKGRSLHFQIPTDTSRKAKNKRLGVTNSPK
eukprot:Gregarina_sp_Poly_1__11360@NODE_958_length_5551_cov_23_957695_g678_i0_p2_GENE_NODE_958_length_5551_cov_23_957695_g678_i0NODE_958_length_5551_cov_23_957695_g678_i0_p2_ORF_typecomplete_len254_score33_73_NODE_958_length_5551_cov_23_957695_g678_i047695530